MTNYTVRVELHGADDGDKYERLHKEMKAQGFSKTITIKGVTYELPTAEYSLRAKTTREAVLKKAETAANKVQPKPQPSILVTSSELSRVFSGLEKI